MYVQNGPNPWDFLQSSALELWLETVQNPRYLVGRKITKQSLNRLGLGRQILPCSALAVGYILTLLSVLQVKPVALACIALGEVNQGQNVQGTPGPQFIVVEDET